MNKNKHRIGKKSLGFLIVVLLAVIVWFGIFMNPAFQKSTGIKVRDSEKNVIIDPETLPDQSPNAGQTLKIDESETEKPSDQKTVPDGDRQQEEENETADDKTQTEETKNDDRENIPVSEKTTAKIVMVGDVLLHTPVSDSGQQEDGTYHYDHLFAHVKDEIKNADLALVNQEVILGGRELGLSGYPAFNGAYEVGDALAEAGFDVVLHATNHALDKGKTGILNCLAFWRTSHPEMTVIGINDSKEGQDHISVLEVNGMHIAVLNYTYGTNGIPLPQDMPYAVNMIDYDQIAEDLEQAEEMADFTIVCPHWGIEYTHQENSAQTELAQFMTEKGADLIIGTHPHVIQPVRWVEALNGNRALVYYSLGNFINATSEYGRGVADRMVGAMAKVTLTKVAGDSKVAIEKYEAVPLVTQMLTGTGRITTYTLKDYNQELAASNEILERDSVFSYDYCVKLADEVLAEAVGD